jgi:hypothetical protein
VNDVIKINQMVNIADYKPHPRNYNHHPPEQIEHLKKSLLKFGQVRSVVVWNGFMLAGHGIREAALILEWKQLRADVLQDDYPEHLALAYVAADNELGNLANPDQSQLLALLQQVSAIDTEVIPAVGYDHEELAALAEQFEIPDDDEWSGAFGNVPDADRSPFQQMTFTLHDDQVEIVKRAIDLAKSTYNFDGSPNENSNGNALAEICALYIEDYGQS